MVSNMKSHPLYNKHDQIFMDYVAIQQKMYSLLANIRFQDAPIRLYTLLWLYSFKFVTLDFIVCIPQRKLIITSTTIKQVCTVYD